MRGGVGLALVVATSIWCFGVPVTAAEPLPPIGDVQHALAARGYDVGVVDGKWGKRSERALQAFQSANGLPPTGILDAATARKLVPMRTDLRAEMARKPADRKDLLLVRSTAELVTLHRLALTGIGSCRPAGFDLGKTRERLRAKFGERFAELERIIQGASAREVTGVLFLDEGFRARTCDDWVATARSTGFTSDPPPVTAVPTSAPAMPEAPARAIAAVPPVESPVAAPPLAPPPTVSPPPAPTESNASLAWKAFGAVSAFAGFVLWRRWRRSSPMPGNTLSTEKANLGLPAEPPRPEPIPAAEPLLDDLVLLQSGPMPSEPSLTERIAAHNRAVGDVIRSRPAAIDPERVPADPILVVEPLREGIVLPPSDLVPQEQFHANEVEREGIVLASRDPTPSAPSLSERITAHNRAIGEVIRERGPLIVRESLPAELSPTIAVEPRPKAIPDLVLPITEPPATSPAWYPGMAPRAAGEWIPHGMSVTIAGLTIPGGLIWVGGSLPCQNDRTRNENCLIDPKLTVATKRDLSGQYMPYWPSYSEIHPWARRAYLDWLAGPREDPTTYIGYVFLYLYGLERRLMLDEAPSDRAVIRGELERLLSVYGGNHSFRRYASDLVSAESVRRGGTDMEPAFDHDIAGFEVPLDVKIALGTRVRDGRPIEPDLLLAFVRTHPETRLRTPARRAAAELRDLFVAEVERRFPNGVKVGGASRIRKLSVTYKAASATFEVDLLPKGLGLPDITGLAEPVGTARAILDECTSRLDAYSRDLGKSPGLAPSLAIFGKLPPEIRLDRVATLPGDPLGALRALAETGEPITVRDLGERVGLSGTAAIDKGRLREWSTLLAGLGYGLTCDPAFSLRAAKAETPAVVFPLSAPSDAPMTPSEGYRHAQVTVALAMMVALADGVVDPSEQRALVDLIDRVDGLDADDRRRLTAEMRVQAADPHALSDLKARLKAIPEAARARLADEIVTIAGADGVAHPREVALLEKLFRQIDVDERTLYARLHGGVANADGRRAAEGDAPRPITVPAPHPPASPSPTTAIDLARLAAIRNETAGITSVLSEIFAEDEPMEIPPVVEPDAEAPDEEGGLDGLDRRHRSLVVEIVERAEWAKDEFDRLVRSVGLMPGAAIETLNDWAYDRFDECLLEGDDPIVANAHLLPPDLLRVTA